MYKVIIDGRICRRGGFVATTSQGDEMKFANPFCSGRRGDFFVLAKNSRNKISRNTRIDWRGAYFTSVSTVDVHTSRPVRSGKAVISGNFR